MRGRRKRIIAEDLCTCFVGVFCNLNTRMQFLCHGWVFYYLDSF